MSSYHVSKSEFSRMAGVTPAAVATNSKLKPAFYGKRIDVRHPAAIAYLESRNIDASQFKPTEPKPVGDRKATVTVGAAAKLEKIKQGEYRGPAETDLQNLPDDIRKLAELPMIEVIEMFGSDIRLKDWADACTRLETLHEKRLKNAERAGELVHCSFFSSILDQIEAFHVKLLTDGSKNISIRSKYMVESGASAEEVALFVKETITKFLKPMKEQIQRKLKDGV